MYRLVRPLLFALPPESAHRLTLRALAMGLGPHQAVPALPTQVGALALPHPVCLAAGLDKDAQAVDAFHAMGFAAVEVGSVTPRPQPGNPTPRLFRIPAQQALINRMGFNNHGLEAMAQRLERPRQGIVGVNLGKNKDTPLEQAADDYVLGAKRLGPLSDYLVVNASSPNTPGLRSLQEPRALSPLLRAVRAESFKPLFLKISPDLPDDELDALIDVALAERLDGLICTNTTLSRPVDHPLAKEPGGLSGDPLRELSTRAVAKVFQRSGGRLPIIGVGGIRSGADAYQKIRAGASAVQLYTGFIYEGPALIRRVADELATLLARDGCRTIAEAAGQA